MPSDDGRTTREVSTRHLAPLIEEALAAGRTVRMTATGGSMIPFIGHGETVELVPAAHRRLAPGDIVLARMPSSEFVLHRVAKAAGHSVFLQGDAQSVAVGPVNRDAVLAVASGVFRGNRRLALDSGLMRAAGLVWMRGAPIRPFAIRATRSGKALVGIRRRRPSADAPVA
ncbi:MAG: S24/S26 family peptidase [Armatimonadetes bacterium]|nr:S24/S26 family peptidase [Armatimonadota bacterium]